MPGSVLIYGPSGVGKTVAVCKTFRRSVVLLTEFDGLASVQTLCGFTPSHVVELFSVDAPFEQIEKAILTVVEPLAKKKEISSVVIDSITEVSDRILGVMMARTKGDSTPTGNAMIAYPEVGRETMKIVRRLQGMGLWVVCTALEQEPKIGIDKKLRRGGPLLPGKLVEQLPGQFSLCLRAAVAPNKTRVLLCDQLDPVWIMKDRYNVCEVEQPLDLGPIMSKVMSVKAALGVKD